MKVLSKFTLKNLKLNRKRTIVTGIGIMLSAALICAVAGMVTSVRQTMINTIIADTGDYHTAYYNVPKDEVEKIENNKKISSYFEMSELGWANLEASKNEAKPYVRLLAFAENTFDKAGIKLSEGRMPTNNKEIVISEHIISNGGVAIKVGDKIALNIGERKLNSTGEYLSQETSVYDNETSAKLDESVQNTTSKEYTVVGKIERPNYTLENYNSPGYTLITYEKNIKSLDKVDIYTKYNNPKDYENVEKEILSIHDEENQYKKKTNSELLRYEGAISEETTKVLYGIAAVVIAIIVVSSVFVIRNSFSISVAEKNKQYGMLSSIGATGKQIRKSVLLEGFLIGVVAIPLGIVLGIIAILILIWLLNVLMVDMLNGVTFVYSVPIIPILLAVLMSAVTIFLSCLVPSIRAGRISPIDSIRGSNDVKVKAKKLKTSKLFGKIFGIGGVIASKNLKRSRKKYRTTIISLVVSVSIFIALSSFLSYGTRMTDIYYTELTFNMEFNSSEPSMYTEVMKLDGIKDYVKYEEKLMNIDLNKYGTDIGKEANKGFEQTNISLVAMDDDSFKAYLKEAGVSTSNFDKKALIMDEFMKTKTDGKKAVEHVLNVNSGDTITIGSETDKLNVIITKKTSERPMGYEGGYSKTGIIFVSKSYAKNIEGLYDRGMVIDAEDADETEIQINKIKDSNENYAGATIENLNTYVEQMNRLFLIVSIFLYGFISVITLIGVTNIFNTITTNMILRSKEFAMLKSIGMTTKEFNKMIRLESILYGLKSLIIGIPIGLVGTYFIYKSFAENTDLGYMLPIKAIIIAAVFVFVIVGLTMKYSLNKINKQNIIDTIRNDNI